MLQVQTLPVSLAGMLWTFRWCFTEPSYRTFVALLAGMVPRTGAWRPHRVHRHGRHDPVLIAETVCLWYGT